MTSAPPVSIPLAEPDPLLRIFNAQPGATLLLSPEWMIVGASDDYLAATLTERSTIVGQYIFDAFPDNPETPEANAVANVRASLTQVMASRQSHDMAPQHYDVPDPARPGHFVERYWKPRHTPVLDAQGHVQFIIHSVQDITVSHLAARQLHESQAAEQAARAEAEAQRQRFYEVIMALPAQIATYHGPNHTYNLINAAYQRYFPAQALPGRTLREVLPETETQGVLAVMDRVYQTGEPSYQPELEVWLDLEGSGQPRQLFLNLFFHALRDAQGRIDGLLDFSYDVTEQVLARRQVEQLNQELEARVQARTREALALQADLLATAQRQAREREAFQHVFQQTPALIALLRAPGHRYEYVNPAYQRLFAGRQLLGLDVAVAQPEAVEQGFVALLDRVYQTGQTYAGNEVPYAVPATQDQPAHEVYFNFTYQAYQENGQTAGISIFAYDVTAQVQARQQAEALQAELLAAAERQVQQREAFYQVFEQTPAAVSLLRGPRHRFEYVNPAFQQVFAGRPPVGLDFAQALPDAGQQGFVALLDRVYQTGQTFFGAEVPFVSEQAGASPRTIYFNFTYQAYREAGQVVGVSSFAVDVTEQVLTRQAREIQRRQLQQVFEQAPVAIFVLRGPAHVFEVVNPSMGQLLGHAPAALLGQPFAQVLPELQQ